MSERRSARGEREREKRKCPMTARSLDAAPGRARAASLKAFSGALPTRARGDICRISKRLF